MISTRWSVMERSFVSVLAEPTVGVSRIHPSYSTKQMSKELSNEIPDLLPIEAISTDWQTAEYRAASENFSVEDALKGIQSGRGLTGLNAEIHQEIERQSGRRSEGFFIPIELKSKMKKKILLFL